MFLPPNNKEMFSNVAVNRTVTASGVPSTARTAGQSIAAALVGMIMALLNGLADPVGWQFAATVFGLACVISVFSSLTSLLRLYG